MNPNYVPKYTNVTDCVKYVRSHHGTQALWRGLSGTIIRNIPANALFFPVNEMTKRYFAQLNQCDVKDIPLSQKLMSGSCAGLSYWVCTYPLDVVKVRNINWIRDSFSRRILQAKMQSNEGKPIGWLQTAKGIYQTGGLRAYSRGLLPCALRAIPACGTMFAIVDTVRGFLTNWWNSSDVSTVSCIYELLLLGIVSLLVKSRFMSLNAKLLRPARLKFRSFLVF